MSDGPEKNSTSRVETESHEDCLSRRGRRGERERERSASPSKRLFPLRHRAHLLVSESLENLSGNRGESKVSNSEVWKGEGMRKGRKKEVSWTDRGREGKRGRGKETHRQPEDQ